MDSASKNLTTAQQRQQTPFWWRHASCAVGNPSPSLSLLQSFVLSGLHSFGPIVIIRLSLVFINDRMTLKVSEESPLLLYVLLPQIIWPFWRVDLSID